MELFPLDPAIREIWKIFPLRIPGPALSRCCEVETILVQSMEGGFVTQNCSRCGNKATLNANEFSGLNLWVACPRCRHRMTEAVVPLQNYGYNCPSCDLAVRLSDLLPRWNEIMSPVVRIIRIGYTLNGPFAKLDKLEVMPTDSDPSLGRLGVYRVEQDLQYANVYFTVPWFAESEIQGRIRSETMEWVATSQSVFRAHNPERNIVFK